MSELNPIPGFTPGKMPLAGAFAAPMNQAYGYFNPSDVALAGVLEKAGQRMTPEYEKEKFDRELKAAKEFYKEQGDQMMKYRMTNDIISNLGLAARAAFSPYSTPDRIYSAQQQIPGTILAGTQQIPFPTERNVGIRYFS
jgi:hypothetical protein